MKEKKKMSEFSQARREGFVKFGYDFNSLAEVTHVWELTAKRLPYCFGRRHNRKRQGVAWTEAVR